MELKAFTMKAKLIETTLCIVIIMLILLTNKIVLGTDMRILSYLTLSFVYAIFKIVLALMYVPKKQKKQRKTEKISVIIPNYNEPVSSVIGCVESLLKQTYPIYEIIFIDDGSVDDSAYHALKAFEKKHKELDVKFIIHKLPKNQGKRIAQAWGFRHATGDYVMLVDSDTHFLENALEELMIPMKDSQMGSVVGHIRPRNSHYNFLTKIQHIGYMSAFRLGRAGQSVMNTVTVCSGACALHRIAHVIENIDEFLEKEVYGIPCASGDDRMLTIFAIRSGYKTQYQATAICETEVPEKVGVLFKQRARWERSAHLLTIKAITTFGWKKPLYTMFILGETYMWLVGTLVTVFSFFFIPEIWTITIAISVVCYYFLITWLTNIYCIHTSWKQFFLVVIFNSVYGVFLFLVRIYAILTIRNSKWSTR